MAALRSGLETQRGVRGNSTPEEAWVKPSADRRRGRLRSEHGAPAPGPGVRAEVRTQSQTPDEAGAIRAVPEGSAASRSA